MATPDQERRGAEGRYQAPSREKRFCISGGLVTRGSSFFGNTKTYEAWVYSLQTSSSIGEKADASLRDSLRSPYCTALAMLLHLNSGLQSSFISAHARTLKIAGMRAGARPHLPARPPAHTPARRRTRGHTRVRKPTHARKAPSINACAHAHMRAHAAAVLHKLLRAADVPLLKSASIQVVWDAFVCCLRPHYYIYIYIYLKAEPDRCWGC